MSRRESARAREYSIDADSIDLKELLYILTLRYYPEDSPFLPKLTWKDFVPYSGIESVAKPMIEGAIRTSVDFGKPKNAGIAISGGVDSTTILALTRKLYPELDIKTLCITFGEDRRESADAKHVAEMFSTDHFEMNISNPLTELPKQISILRVPRWNAYTYYIFDYFNKNRVDVILTGDGGDEMFGGYAFRYKEILASRENALDAEMYLNTHKMDWVPDQQKMFGRKIKFRWEDVYSSISDYFNNPLSKLGQTFLADYNGKLLYDFAPTNTSFANHFNLNLTAPILSSEVIYTAAHIPYNLKYDAKNNVGKIILRQILLESFAYKSAVKGKIGFGMDRVEMWHKTRDSAVSMFERARCTEFEIIDKGWLIRAIKKADSGEGEVKLRYLTKLFMILALEVWLRLFVTKEMKANDKL